MRDSAVTFTAFALAQLMTHCKARYVSVGSQTSVISVESTRPGVGLPDSNAIHDNTTGASYYPNTRDEAVAIAHRLLAAGHLLDVGLGQLDSSNFPGLHVTADDMLDPCLNVYVTGQFLERKWRAAFSAVSYDRRRERQALEMMVSLYHANNYRSPEYIDHVVDAAGTRYVRRVVVMYGRLRQRQMQLAQRSLPKQSKRQGS